MTREQIEGLVRMALGVLAGWAISYGIDAATWATITGGLVALVGAAWSLYSNSISSQVENVANDPGTVSIVLENKKAANAQPSPKVTAHDPERDI